MGKPAGKPAIKKHYIRGTDTEVTRAVLAKGWRKVWVTEDLQILQDRFVEVR